MNGFEFEKLVKKNLKGARVIVKSGATFHDEDLITKTNIIQTKYTTQHNYTLNVKDVNRLYMNALLSLKQPLLLVGFDTGSLVTIIPKRLGVTTGRTRSHKLNKSITISNHGTYTKDYVGNYILEIKFYKDMDEFVLRQK